MYFFIGNRKFIVANKNNIYIYIKKVSHTSWVIKPNYDAGG